MPAASALTIYRLAHRYGLKDLNALSMNHLVCHLGPSNAFTLLLATPLWTDLHLAIKGYVYDHWSAILVEPDFKQCFEEVSQGRWYRGGETLFEVSDSGRHVTTLSRFHSLPNHSYPFTHESMASDGTWVKWSRGLKLLRQISLCMRRSWIP